MPRTHCGIRVPRLLGAQLPPWNGQAAFTAATNWSGNGAVLIACHLCRDILGFVKHLIKIRNAAGIEIDGARQRSSIVAQNPPPLVSTPFSLSLRRSDSAELSHGRKQARQPPNSTMRHNPAYGMMRNFVYGRAIEHCRLRLCSLLPRRKVVKAGRYLRSGAFRD